MQQSPLTRLQCCSLGYSVTVTSFKSKETSTARSHSSLNTILKYYTYLHLIKDFSYSSASFDHNKIQ